MIVHQLNGLVAFPRLQKTHFWSLRFFFSSYTEKLKSYRYETTLGWANANFGVNYPFLELKLLTNMFEQYFVDCRFKFSFSITRKPNQVKNFSKCVKCCEDPHYFPMLQRDLCALPEHKMSLLLWLTWKWLEYFPPLT